MRMHVPCYRARRDLRYSTLCSRTTIGTGLVLTQIAVSPDSSFFSSEVRRVAEHVFFSRHVCIRLPCQDASKTSAAAKAGRLLGPRLVEHPFMINNFDTSYENEKLSRSAPTLPTIPASTLTFDCASLRQSKIVLGSCSPDGTCASNPYSKRARVCNNVF
ncbi:uncharacterized protein EKO05_0002229 [Ascochyta rabiei]|uniref:uncharacterized protein n=1 Tax=Didymella rabiei TaxID=5454 RepID=UPI0021FA482E|nr:uncharacterized protein EKO05_0002229 [Ascochyta rabiei]UPX11634.1 hypothetical protein EKO05_0002229 [Ascochyta rabiei]